ncbi:MAG: 16S rRNA (guanine(527)-N(7))-methyltransferase RsmG [Parahaliea sp.]
MSLLDQTQWRRWLIEGCQQIPLVLGDEQLDQLLAYLVLLQKWNRTYNLSAIRDPREMIHKHLLDSLVVAPLLKGQQLIDVGTGAGLPGVPLAIAFPERAFHLLDSNGKKTRFLFQVKTVLGLANMTVHHTRVENYQPLKAFDTVLSRAFASLSDMVDACAHLLADDGCFLALKGIYPEQELRGINQCCRVLSVTPLSVPGLQEQRHLVTMALCENKRAKTQG